MDKVLEYLQQNQPRFIKGLCEHIRFPSVSAQPQHQNDLCACAQWLLKTAQECGLQAELFSTQGNPILIARTPRTSRKKRPHFVIYGHYDVQPPDPLELWRTPPFEPRLEAHAVFGRGASDNKGQHLAHFYAVEAFLRAGVDLPCDLTFLIEGEEEIGSRSLAAFLRKQKASLRCDAVVISDTGMPDKQHPALTYALRGVMAVEVKIYGPNRDLHSGIFGGTVENPAMALCRLLAQMRDGQGRIAIPGFYNDVEPLSDYERKELARIPFNQRAFQQFLGVPKLFGETGFTPIEQRSARPTAEINGLTSGYQGEGNKTIIPAWASAKLTFRLVPNQNPEKIRQLVLEYFRKTCPPSVRMEVEAGHGGEPYLVSPTGPYAQAALRALHRAFHHEPLLMREGGSIPIVTDFQKILGVQTLLLGLALPDDNAHSPNEKFDLDNFYHGMAMSAYLWQELAACPPPKSSKRKSRKRR